MSNKKSSRNYKVLYIDEKNVLEILDKDGNKEYIPLIKYYGKWNYIALLPKDTELDGKIYPKGTIIVWNGPATEDDRSYTIITDPKYDNRYYNKPKDQNDYFGMSAKILDDLKKLNAKYYNAYSKFLISNKNKDWLTQTIEKGIHKAMTSLTSEKLPGILEGGAVGAITTNLPSDTTSSSPSFDFIDNILGNNTDSKKEGTTDYDPNAVVNNSINSGSLNQIKKNTISELVADYTDAMKGILSNYGNKDMYNLYSKDII